MAFSGNQTTRFQAWGQAGRPYGDFSGKEANFPTKGPGFAVGRSVDLLLLDLPADFTMAEGEMDFKLNLDLPADFTGPRSWPDFTAPNEP